MDGSLGSGSRQKSRIKLITNAPIDSLKKIKVNGGSEVNATSTKKKDPPHRTERIIRSSQSTNLIRDDRC